MTLAPWYPVLAGIPARTSAGNLFPAVHRSKILSSRRLTSISVGAGRATAISVAGLQLCTEIAEQGSGAAVKFEIW